MLVEPCVAVFVHPYAGHAAPLRPLVAGLAARDVTVWVFTGGSFTTTFAQLGAQTVDLFGRYPLEEADDESMPLMRRHVTFAAHYAPDIVRDLKDLGPALIIADTMAVIGRVVATALQVPWVNVSAGHNVAPQRFQERIRRNPRATEPPRLVEAVATLRERYGIADASPFSHVTGLSPFLNVLCEPQQWLSDAERAVFEPVAFFGCLPPAAELEALRSDAQPAYFPEGALKVYVSFGTVPWWYWPDVAHNALTAISRALGGRPRAHGLIGLGDAPLSEAQIEALRSDVVTVEPYVDSWRALRDADVFVTAQGLNSTHEAIFNRVPMVSYPFFWDQPELAERCQALGIALPLGDAPRAPIDVQDVVGALDAIERRGGRMRQALEHARAWELEALAGREEVLDRILDLIASA